MTSGQTKIFSSSGSFFDTTNLFFLVPTFFFLSANVRHKFFVRKTYPGGQAGIGIGICVGALKIKME